LGVEYFLGVFLRVLGEFFWVYLKIFEIFRKYLDIWDLGIF